MPLDIPPTTRIPLIPVETIEHIATFLWDNPHTILQCTLVCRSWRDATYPYLFRRVTIDDGTGLEQLEDLLSHNNKAAYWIRELHFQASRWALNDWILDMPGKILPEKLENLYAIGINGLRIRRSHTDFIERFSRFRFIRSLSFVGCSTPDGFLLAFTHAFPGLCDLRLRDMKIIATGNQDAKESTFPLPPPGTSPPLLTHFSIRDHRFRESIGNFVALKSLETVRSLEIHHSGTAFFHDEVGRTLLPTCGPSLRSLKLVMHRLPSNPPASLVDIFQFHWRPGPVNMSELRTLELNMRPLHHVFVADMLDFARKWCLKLRMVTFHISFDSPEDIRPGNYTTLNGRLQSLLHSLPGISEVRFKYGGMLDKQNVQSRLCEVFPCVAELGPRCVMGIEIL